MKKIQGENNTFIEFLKNKASLEIEKEKGKILSIEEVKESKEKISLADALNKKVKDLKLNNFDVEESLVLNNQKIINKIRFEFFRDFSKELKKSSLNPNIFGRMISSKYLVPSLAIGCVCLLVFSLFINSLRSNTFNNSTSRLSSSGEELNLLSEKERVQKFILNNSEKGRVAGVEESLNRGLPAPPTPPNVYSEENKSGFMKVLSSFATKQIELSNLMNNKLLNFLNKD